VVIVDDALLLAVLAGTAPEEFAVALEEGEIATTGSWYWRIGRALRDTASTGSLSRALTELDPGRQAHVLAAIDDLPAAINLPSLRHLVPVMTALRVGRPLNLLTAEAIAAAIVLDASIAVTTRSALLTESCDRLGVGLRLLSI